MKLWFGEGCGNTFLVLYGDRIRAHLYLEKLRIAGKWIFDTALILQESMRGMFAMEVVEQDGSQSAMCGNGLRVIGAVLQRRQCVVQVGESIYRIERTSHRQYRVLMGTVVTAGRITLPDIPVLRVFSVGGEPHAVCSVRSVQNAPLARWGSCIVPTANCTLYESIASGVLAIRTFERGVHSITQSCGTGACAAAQSWFECSGYEKSITLLAHGHTLHVHRVEDQLVLEGPAQARPISPDQLGIEL